MQTPSAELREAWLKEILPHIKDSGWTDAMLAETAKRAGLDRGEQALAAPNGVEDLIDHVLDQAMDDMMQTLAKEDLDALRTHERVGLALQTWLEQLEPHRHAVAKAAGRGLLPWGASAAARRTWATADTIWIVAGDTATDYNRQTKRALLSAVIPGVVLQWLAGVRGEDLKSLIDKRLQLAMQVGQRGGQVLGPLLDRISSLKSR